MLTPELDEELPAWKQKSPAAELLPRLPPTTRSFHAELEFMESGM